MTQHLDYLDAGAFEERLMTKEEILQKLTEWKAKASKPEEEVDDTTPLSKAEIAQKLFEGRCMAVLREGKMKAGYFCDLVEVKAARGQLRDMVGAVMADEILSDFFVNNNHLFT